MVGPQQRPSERILQARANLATVELVRVALCGAGASEAQALVGSVSEDRLLAAIARHRVAILLADHDEDLPLPSAVASRVRAMARAERLAAMRLAGITMRVSSLLSNAGVEHALFKGVILSVLSTGDFTSRGAGDIDLMVRVPDLAGLADHLPGWSWRRDRPPDPKITDRYNEAPLIGPICLDVHWGLLAPAYAMTWDANQILADSRVVQIGGNRVRTLSGTDTAMMSIFSAWKDPGLPLRHLVDLHRLVPAGQLETLAGPAQQRDLDRYLPQTARWLEWLGGGDPPDWRSPPNRRFLYSHPPGTRAWELDYLRHRLFWYPDRRTELLQHWFQNTLTKLWSVRHFRFPGGPHVRSRGSAVADDR